MNIPLRWVAIGVFLFSSTLNYLDRQMFAALAPGISQEFHLSNEQYGLFISAFSLIYALSSPLVGLFIDRAGLNRGIGICVGVWSLATMATGWVESYAGLMASRALLGAAQSGGVPAAGKSYATYLPPPERSLGTALGQVGISMGMMLAPLVAGWMAPRYGWRSAFLVAGAAGFFWIPVWLFTARRVPTFPVAAGAVKVKVADMLRDKQYWGLIVGVCLGMTLYSLWTNWTTKYLVQVFNLTQEVANERYAWIPPLCGIAGGLGGGAITLRLARRGMHAHRARMYSCAFASVMALVTIFVPMAQTAGTATAAIGLSFFFTTWFSVNAYSMPLDIFGPERAAFAIASLTLAYGMIQFFISPAIGRVVDLHGFGPVCMALAFLPLIGTAVLKFTEK
jgi:ACS family hexuronate transporter-like MFS transporter